MSNIVRAPRPESNYYILDKRISEDSRLGWAARGLLIYLLGKPDNWEVSAQNLINQTENAAVASGRDAVYALLKQLMAAGYLRKVTARSEAGQVASVTYQIGEIPFPDNPEVAQLTAQPETAQPHPANPTQTKNDSKQESKASKTDDDSSGAKPAKPKPEKKPKPKPTDGFEAFWEAYPRRVGKENALKAYSTARSGKPQTKTASAVPPATAEEIMAGLEAWGQVWEFKQTGLEFIPHASTWLNQRRFTDDLRGEIEHAKRGNNRPGSHASTDRLESGLRALMGTPEQGQDGGGGPDLFGF